MKKIFLLFLFCTMPLLAGIHTLSVSENGRYLVTTRGEPFFWMGDTAWELFHRLNMEEAELYLTDRADKGFTVIQAVVLAELDGLNTPNAYGHTPLIDNDPLQPNEAYFEHVDEIVYKASELGLYIGMLPTWGDKFNLKWGVGPEIFTPENAEKYGAWLAERYRDWPIIWILGGDRTPEDLEDKQIIAAMAKGIRQSDPDNPITYHPSGGSLATDYFPREDWLDFDFYQSGHHVRMDGLYLVRYNEKSLANSPQRPVINGEPNYEDHPVNWLREGETGWFDDFDCRYAAYISMLTGACGHTYGNHNIWQMWQTNIEPVSWARTHWQRALDYPGAFQMGYLASLLQSLPWQYLVTGSYTIQDSTSASFRIITLAQNAQWLMAYTANGSPLHIDMTQLEPEIVNASWFNPRDGWFLDIGSYASKDTLEFTPRSQGRGSDWILLLKK